MRKKNTTAVRGEASVHPPTLKNPEKQHLSLAKALTHQVFVMKINHCDRQSSRPGLQ